MNTPTRPLMGQLGARSSLSVHAGTTRARSGAHHARLALAATALSLLAASAQAYPWTSPGSAGTLDETATATDLLPSQLTMSGPYATLKSTATLNSPVSIRYNVTDVFDKSYIFTPSLEMRFLDSGDTTRVQAALRAYNTVTGALRTLATLDSNAFAASAGYQTQWSCSPNNLWINDFMKEVYYVEVTMSRSATAGSAAVAALRVDECLW